MKILVTSVSYYPDHSGIALYSTDFANYAAEQGHDVEVITGYSFYPKWKKRDEDKGKLFSSEVINNVKILRGYLSVPAKPTTFTRVIQEMTFLASSFVNYFRAKKPDVIVVFTTPISIGYLAGFFKYFSKAKLVINVQDFQLEAAASLGMANQGIFFKILSYLERRSYKRSAIVSSISDSMVDLLRVNKVLPEDQIYLWPNWVKVADYKLDESRKGEFRKAHNIADDAIIVAYAGNVGLKQGLEILIDLAKVYQTNDKLKFFLIGEGAGISELKTYAETLQVSNLQLIPLLNHKQYLDFLTDLDIFFLSQKKTQFDVYFPSKLLGLMAAKKLLLLSADKESELYRSIKSNNIGLVSEFGDIEKLTELLNTALTDKEMIAEISLAAEKYAANFDRDYVLNNVLTKLKSL